MRSVAPAGPADDEAIAKYEAEQALRARNKKRNAAWLASNVPHDYRAIPLEPIWNVLPEHIESIPVREPYRVAFTRLIGLENLRRGTIIAMLGDRGPGKTWMGCCLVKRFCNNARSAVYSDAPRYLDEIRDSFNGGRKLEVQSRYERPELLVMDAIEEKGSKTFHEQEITQLVNRRMQGGKLTLIISNDLGETLEERIGRSLADRINDGGGFITCRWPSLRGHI